MALDIPLRKTNTKPKRLSFLGPKIWSKINPSNKNEHKLLKNFFFHACFKEKCLTSSANIIIFK